MIFNTKPLVNWSNIANANSSKEDVIKLYRKLITEEYNEVMNEKSGTPQDFNECCDLIWVTAIYCLSQGYDLDKGLNALIEANSSKFYDKDGNFNPQYREDGKLLKGSGFNKPDWNKLFTTSQL